MPKKKYDVFLSYNSKNRIVVQTIAQALRARTLSVFFDGWEVLPGDPVQETLENALSDSSACAVCVGPAGLGAWQNEEMRAAVEERVRTGKLRVVPILLPGLQDISVVPRFLRRLSCIDARCDPDFGCLAEDLRRVTRRSTGPKTTRTGQEIAPQVVKHAQNAAVIMRDGHDMCRISLFAHGDPILLDRNCPMVSLRSIEEKAALAFRASYRFMDSADPPDKEMATVGMSLLSLIASRDAIRKISSAWLDSVTVFVDESLMFVPWEILCIDSQFLKERAIIGIRIIADNGAVVQDIAEPTSARPRILVMQENRHLSREVEKIETASRQSDLPCDLRVVSFYSSPEETIFAELAEGPDVIHVAASHDKAYLKSADGDISDEIFAALVAHKRPRLILQMVCSREFGRFPVADKITLKLASTGTAFIYSSAWIGYREAMEFTESFYGNIFSGASLGEALWKALPKNMWYRYRLIGDPRQILFRPAEL